MKVYAVAKWEDFYPNPDNVIKVFMSEEDAEKFLEEYKKERSDPFSHTSRYDIFEYDIEE